MKDPDERTETPTPLSLLGGKLPWGLPIAIQSSSDGEIRARCAFAGDEPWFEGHFPGDPLVPGIVLLEAMVQAAAQVWGADPGHTGSRLMVLGLDRVRFRRAVRPGETLEIGLTIKSERGPMRVLTGRGSVDGEPAVSARLRLSLAPGGVRR